MADNISKIEQLKKDYLHIFKSETGERVLEDLEKRCFVNGTTFAGEVERTLFNEGMRCAFLHIKMMMELDIEKLKKIEGEK